MQADEIDARVDVEEGIHRVFDFDVKSTQIFLALYDECFVNIRNFKRLLYRVNKDLPLSEESSTAISHLIASAVWTFGAAEGP